MSTQGTNRVSRWRSRVLLAGVVVVVAAFLVGVVLLLVGRFTQGSAAPSGVGTGGASSHASAAPTPEASGTGSRSRAAVLAEEDKIADRPMRKGQGIARQMEANATTTPLGLPKSTRMVDGLVPSGFPMTPAGAVAQLAALNQVAYHNFSVDQGRQVYEAFAMPGAVPINRFAPTGEVLQYYQQNSFADPQQITATYTPVQGLIKGTADDGRWVLACTLGRLTYAQNNDSATVGAPDCERMQWANGRWMLGPGTVPATPTLTWPRSADSYKAGFRDLQGVSF